MLFSWCVTILFFPEVCVINMRIGTDYMLVRVAKIAGRRRIWVALSFELSYCRNGWHCYQLNPITYGGGGGFLARTIRLVTTTLLRPLSLAPPNLVPFCCYLLDNFGRILAKLIHQGGGGGGGRLLQLFLKWDVSNTRILEHCTELFVLLQNHVSAEGGIN